MTRFSKWLLAGLIAMPMTGQAGDVSLPYSAQTQALALKTHPVGKDTSHVIGVAAFDGRAEMGGETAQHGYGGQLEMQDGTGTIRGYAHWTFDDGSWLTARYEGRILDAPSDVDFDAAIMDVQGGGRFEGASGSGQFSGHRPDASAGRDHTEITGQLDLKLPD